jgi:hypothetical protein
MPVIQGVAVKLELRDTQMEMSTGEEDGDENEKLACQGHPTTATGADYSRSKGRGRMGREGFTSLLCSNHSLSRRAVECA